MALYDGIFCNLNGALFQENTSVDLSYEGDNQAVLTTVKGYAGESPSPKMTVIQFENVVPPTGFEFDVFKMYTDSTEVEIKLQSGATGKSLTSKGFIQSPKVSSGVGKVTSLSFGFRGAPAVFQ